jgi:hypothetical protein
MRRRRPFIQPTKGASYGNSQFFFLAVQNVFPREAGSRPGREQGRQGQHLDQQGEDRARQRRAGHQPGLRRPQRQQPFFQEQQQVTARRPPH